MTGCGVMKRHKDKCAAAARGAASRPRESLHPQHVPCLCCCRSWEAWSFLMWWARPERAPSLRAEACW